MTDRITMKNLEYQVERINKAMNSPAASYTRDKAGKLKANIGNYHLDGAYGGWKLARMTSEGGGITCITSGFVPKRELYNQLQAFLSGIEAAQ